MINSSTNEDLVAIGGKSGIQVAPNTTVLIKAGAGRLVRISTNAAGTGAGDVQFLDAASIAGGGPVIARLAATTGTLPVNGAPVQFDLPFFAGLVVINPVNGPVMYVSFD